MSNGAQLTGLDSEPARSAGEVQAAARGMARAVGALAACLLVLAAAVVYAEVRDHPVWSPLGNYPTQTVTSRLPGIEGPAVHIGELVRVVAEKCNTTDAAVDVVGHMFWQAMDPPGSVIETGAGAGVREVGCVTQEFANPIPAAVQSVISAQHAAGIAQPRWRIRGDETPVRDDGDDGRPARWVTENFTVVP
jgi:hypothetical protein